MDYVDMDLISKVIKEEDKFILENGLEAKFLIMSASDAGELAYEVGKNNGQDDIDAYTNDLTRWRDKIICVVFDKNFEGFILK